MLIEQKNMAVRVLQNADRYEMRFKLSALGLQLLMLTLTSEIKLFEILPNCKGGKMNSGYFNI